MNGPAATTRTPTRGVALEVYSELSAHMAATLAWGLAKVSPDLPLHVRVRDCLPRVRWPEQAEVRMARSTHTGQDGLQWLNKLEALHEAPFDETLLLDADIVVLRDIRWWFDALGTDDFTFWNFLRRREDCAPGVMELNLHNPHAFCEHYGVEAVPTILGYGHYFYRRSARGERLLQRVADHTLAAAESADALYWKLALPGNMVSDEPATSMAAVELGIRLPAPGNPLPEPRRPIGLFVPPFQEWREADFAAQKARFYCAWNRREMEPDVIHFAGPGKHDPVYAAWREAARP